MLAPLIMGAMATVGISAVASAQMNLRMSSQWTENTIGSQVDKWWAQEIEKRTGGKVKIKIFFEGALGKASENLTLIREGAIDLTAMSASYFPADLPLHTAPNSIPMAMAEVPQATQLIQRLLKEVPALDEEAKKNGMKALFFHHLNPYVLVCKPEIKGIADMKGKKLRTWGADMPRMAQAAGAVPVTLGLPELYESLSRGTVDCLPFSVDLMVNYKIFEVAKNVYDITLWLGPTNGNWIGRKVWDKIPPDQQKIIEEVSREAANRDRDLTMEAAAKAVETLKSNGVKFHKFPDADKKMWKQSNPDFFADFIAAQEKAGRGDAARKMVQIWKEVVGG
jgi:TRAP-type C4-dicarboxylate transport system substrate-binding protein